MFPYTCAGDAKVLDVFRYLGKMKTVTFAIFTFARIVQKAHETKSSYMMWGNYRDSIDALSEDITV